MIKNWVFYTIYLLQRLMVSSFSQEYYREVKRKLPRPGFELKSLIQITKT